MFLIKKKHTVTNQKINPIYRRHQYQKNPKYVLDVFKKKILFFEKKIARAFI